MSDEGLPAVTDADVRSLAARLKGLHALLTPGEQALLHTVLRRAVGRDVAQPADTRGFAWAVSFNPLPYLDAIAAERQREHGGP
jgi:hypothetical protein